LHPNWVTYNVPLRLLHEGTDYSAVDSQGGLTCDTPIIDVVMALHTYTCTL